MVLTVITTKYPSLIFNNRESAEKEAEKIGKDICFIEYHDTSDGSVYNLGYGLYDCEEERILGTKDFINVHF